MMPRAIVRPLDLGDLDHMMEWVNDREVIGNFANFATPTSRSQEQKYLENLLKSETDKAFTIETEQGDYLGTVGIYQIHWPARSGRLGIIIGKPALRGKGYGQSAIKDVLRLAFEQYNLHKVWLVVFEENARSRHVYTKCGFREEGILRDEYFHQGKYHNMVRMSILDREYFAEVKI